MDIHKNISSIRKAVLSARQQDRSICLVPTMGNLHAGHLSLVKYARKQADQVIVSLFVNPLQFGPNEDLDSYPRTFANDCELLVAEGVEHLFAPTPAEMYPHSSGAAALQTQVIVPGLSDILCGESRPTHFAGVSTVVSMLFNIVQADIAVFGNKDFQQLAIIRKMVRDLQIPIDIVGCPIVREPDGLAMSSRNNYLSAEERTLAPKLNQAVNMAAEQIRNGDRDYNAVCDKAIKLITATGFRSDYFSVRNRHTMAAAQNGDKELVIVAAAWLGKPRLLDNIELTLK